MQLSHQRESGLHALDKLAWGSHFCQFYNEKQDLVETLVPYFSAGLRNNESCLWITSEPLEAAEAKELMVHAVPDFKSYLAKGQIEIRDLRDWYTPAERFDADGVLAAWIEREARAKHDGYEGLRLTGNTFWLERAGWNDFMDYERKVNNTFGRYHVLGLCTYCLKKCSAQDVIDVVQNHQFALSRQAGKWQMIESASLAVAKASLERLNQELESRVGERTQELETALRGRDEFLAMLAHELRNPLAPIRSAAQVVRLVSSADPKLAQASQVLERQVGHMTRLVDDLLDTARITRGAVMLRKEVVSVGSVLARAVETAQPQIAARRHSLGMSLPSEPLRVHADPTRLAQVLGNLLDNAAKYTPEGGKIDLKASREGEQAVLSVRDNGAGIPPEMLGCVFDLFTQVGPPSDRAEGGLGLGLTLVRRLVEMHGGSVEAKSAGAGKGAEFIVRLPLTESAAAPERHKAAEGKARQRVLVVDDNADAGHTIAMTLELMGHEAKAVLDGSRALDVAPRFRPDLVLLDIGLPGMDGYEVAQRLRAIPEVAQARLVALTGYGQRGDRRRGFESGFDDYFVKPISPEVLEQLLVGRSVH